ncbi:hypothetical protein PHSY_002102 [Pseudozyma hubeiensis SY62]|uniref:Uncharacterized protein n=1 Tax=Pseudozyma hubeiensis (strain SY62) TaxID=1305764 RepID=R9P8W1_PSEHS|nr:hypothetical protein PHSY_002102 [Pseudozyma hubeiensis SY62]GAC94530.1 hypothetical protein PHSY_002102 [Pseudozyma hubeiensis SY62]
MSGWHRRHPCDWPLLDKPLGASTWCRLPPELVLHVVESASWLVPADTLTRWCLVDRAWYRRTIVPLYACVALSPRDDDALGALRIERFCKTISCSKQLAAYVKALDFAVSREEHGIANQDQYLAILTHCRNLIYLRNLQRLRDPEDTYLPSVPSGALARLRWHDSDLRAFEELVESVFKPLHFRSNPDARGIERSDLIALDARSCSRMLYDLRLIARLPSVHKLPKGFLRNMAVHQMPRQKLMAARCSKQYQNDRIGMQIAVGVLNVVSRILPQLELVEIYLADRDCFTGAPSHFVSKASATGLPCLYPRSFWQDLVRQMMASAPFPFAVAFYHVCSNEVGDAPGFDIGGDYDEPSDSISSPEYPYTIEEDEDILRRNTTGAGWQEPFLLLPHSSHVVPIKFKGGYRSLPFSTYKKDDKPAWDVLIDPPPEMMPDQTRMADAQEEWDVESMLGTSRPRLSPMHPLTPRRGSLDWLRLVSRNLEFGKHDLFL